MAELLLRRCPVSLSSCVAAVVLLCCFALWLYGQAKQLAGLKVVATASRPESAAAAIALGADVTVNHREPLQAQLTAAGIDGVDYIYNAYDSGTYFDQYVDIIKPLGKIVSIVSTSRDLPMSKLMSKRVTYVWELMFTRPLYGVEMEKQRHILDTGARLIDGGLLKLPAVKVLPFTVEALRGAHTSQESGEVIGKIVLTRETA